VTRATLSKRASNPCELRLVVASDADNRVEQIVRLPSAGEHELTFPLQAMRRVGFPNLREIEQVEFETISEPGSSLELTFFDLRFVAGE